MPHTFLFLALSCYLFLVFYTEYADPFPVSLIISPCSVRVSDLPREDEAQYLQGNTNTGARPVVPVIHVPSHSSPVKKKSEGVSVTVFRLNPSSVHHKKRSILIYTQRLQTPVDRIFHMNRFDQVRCANLSFIKFHPESVCFVPAPDKKHTAPAQVFYKTNNNNRFFPWNDGVGEFLWCSPYA